jgi:hypothetical protein
MEYCMNQIILKILVIQNTEKCFCMNTVKDILEILGHDIQNDLLTSKKKLMIANYFNGRLNSSVVYMKLYQKHIITYPKEGN